MVVERKRSLGLAAARGEAEHRGLVSGGALACALARGVLCLWEAKRKRVAAAATKWLCASETASGKACVVVILGRGSKEDPHGATAASGRQLGLLRLIRVDRVLA